MPFTARLPVIVSHDGIGSYGPAPVRFGIRMLLPRDALRSLSK